MANAIGSAALILTTNATKLYAGLAEAGSRSKSMVAKIGSNIGSGLSKSLGGIGSGIRQLVGGIASIAKSGAMAGIGVAAAAAAVSVGVLYKGIASIHDLVQQGDMAKSLGVSPEFFTGLAGAASSYGVELGALFEGLVNMGGKASEAMKGGEAGNAFRRLGLDVQAFNNMGVESQFAALVQGLNSIADPAERVRIGMQVLGEEAGKKMIPLISKSSDELSKLTSKYAVSAGEMSKMKLADDAIRSMTQAAEGLWKQVLVGLAPIIEFFAVKLTSAIESSQPILDTWGQVFSTYWTILVDVIAEVYSAIAEVINEVADWLNALTDVSNWGLSLQSILVGALNAIAVAGGYCWDSLKAGVGMVALAVGKLTESIAWVIRQFSALVTAMKKLPANIRPPGLDSFIAGIDELAASTQKSGEQMSNWGVGTFTNFGKSAEQVDKWFGKKSAEWLHKSTAMPRGSGAFVGPPAPPAEKPAQEIKYSAVSAAVQGSKEALSIEAKYKTEQMTDPKIALQQKQLAEQQKQTAAIKEVAEAIAANKLPLLGVF